MRYFWGDVTPAIYCEYFFDLSFVLQPFPYIPTITNYTQLWWLPNVVVAHQKEGIEAVHLASGRTLCKVNEGPAFWHCSICWHPRDVIIYIIPVNQPTLSVLMLCQPVVSCL